MKTNVELEVFKSNISDIYIARIENEFVREFNWLLDFHQSNYSVILWVDRGKANVWTSRTCFELGSNTCLILPRNLLCKINLIEVTNGMFLAFNDSFFSNRYNTNMLSQFYFFSFGVEPSPVFLDYRIGIRELCVRIMTEYREKRSHLDKILRSYLNILFIELERTVVGKPESKLGNFDSKDEKLKRFYELIRKNFKSWHRAYQYAEEIGISVGYLRKIIKEKTGSSPALLIRGELINQGKNLLVTTNLTVKEIAYELGFENTSYFNTFFKSMESTTPENYRQSRSSLQ